MNMLQFQTFNSFLILLVCLHDQAALSCFLLFGQDCEDSKVFTVYNINNDHDSGSNIEARSYLVDTLLI